MIGTEPEGVTVSPDGTLAWVACESGNNITVIDTHARKVTANILVDPRPRATIFARDGRRASVTSELGSSLALVDPATSRGVKRLHFGGTDRPVGMALSPDERRLYVANNLSNSVSVIDTGSLRVVRTIPAGDGPWGIAVATHQPAP